ncbi:hypothetical protein Tco_1182031 [Tanacetum coccineum]
MAEENNTDNQAEIQVENAQINEDEFYNIFSTPNKDHLLEQVRGNPSKPVQTRRQLAIDLEMCMFALIVSKAEPKNIKEAMADHAWIEAMQEELHQFDRLKVWELVDKPFGKTVIKLKWLCKNKKDEDNTVILNKARLVAKGTSDPPIPTRPTDKHLKEVKRIFRYLKGTINMGLWYLKDYGFKLTAFLDVDHVGCLDTRKSTSGGIQFLGDKLVSWKSKKQDCTAMSSAEADYVALSISYAQHSRTKHIHTRYHFIKEQVRHGIIELYFIRTEYLLADMFTKALPQDRFKYLVRRIGMRCLTLAELEVLANETD